MQWVCTELTNGPQQQRHVVLVADAGHDRVAGGEHERRNSAAMADPPPHALHARAASNIAKIFSGGVPAWMTCDGPRMYPPS